MTNKHKVPVSVASCACWEFLAPSEAATISDKTGDIIKTAEQLFDAFGKFLTPIRLTYEKRIYDTDRSLKSIDVRSKPTSNLNVELADEQGLDRADFLESTEIDTSGVVLIPAIRFDQNRYLLWLGDNRVSVKRSDCVLYHKGEPREQAASIPDPLEIRIGLRETTENDEIQTEYVKSVSINLMSELFVKNTASGKANKTRLGTFLEQVAVAMSATDVRREQYDHSDFWHDVSLIPQEVDFDMETIF